MQSKENMQPSVEKRAEHFRLARYKIGIVVGLTEVRGGSKVKIASGFLLENEDKTRLIVTVEHLLKKILTWHNEGIVETCFIIHHCSSDEDNLVVVPFNKELIQKQILVPNAAKIDCGIILLDSELDQSLRNASVGFFSFPNDLEIDKPNSQRECAILGFDASGTKSFESNGIIIPHGGEYLQTVNTGIGTFSSRKELVAKTEIDTENASRLKITPVNPNFQSLLGLSGGPIVVVENERPPKLLGQQVSQWTDGSKGGKFEYAYANNRSSIINAVNDCIQQHQDRKRQHRTSNDTPT